MSGIHDIIGNVINLNEPVLITKKEVDSVSGEIALKVKHICNKKIYINTRPTPILERA